MPDPESPLSEPLQSPFLSIVIPAYNEESRILETLGQVVEFLASQSYSWEVVVVDDGSTDGTASLVSDFASRHSSVRLITVPHRGKGWAVKHGMLDAAGAYRFLCDADLSMPIEQVERFLPPQLDGVDIAIGSREAPNSRRIGEPARRHTMGRLFNGLVRVLAVPGLDDTQCGFKCFRGEIVSELFQRQTLDGFAFDVELLFMAYRSGMKIQEVGIDWYYRDQSKVRQIHDSFAMTRDLLKIRWRHKRRR
ncbi:MAG: glycosyltransferase family 2 protein [Chloroflexi bacterium]|nr:glycosyltransferase family 2 protein [Chloroflexota bacterium]MDA1218601.1 glycosyltransferase family 2 protein [Chloroflexota bacterium]